MDYADLTKMLKTKKTKSVFEVFDFIKKTENSVTKENIVKFYKGYSLALYNKDKKDWNKPPIFSLGEKIGKDETIPLITEFKFTFSDKNKKNELDEQMDKDCLSDVIIEIHHQLIKEFFVIGYNQQQYLCVVGKSRLVRDGDHIILRLRYQFPYCRVKKDFLSVTFRERLMEELEVLDTDDLFYSSTVTSEKFEREWDNYLLPVKDIYPLIGSTDDEKLPPLMYDGVYGMDEKEYDSDEEKEIEDPLVETYKVTSHKFFQEKYISDEEVSFDDFDDDYEKKLICLPIFLSIFFWEEMTKLKNGEHDDAVSVSGGSMASAIPEKIVEDYEEITPYEMFIELAECLSPKRFNTEMYLLDIGKCLFNCFDGSYEGLQAWITYTTERSDVFKEDFCHENYPKFVHENYITIKTIGWYAREDNISQYQSWHEKYCLPKMKIAISRDSFPQVLVAQAFHRFFWLDYIYVSGKERRWFRFKNHRLSEISEESIRRDITEKFIPCFDNFRNQYMMEKIDINRKIGSSENAKRMTADFEKTIKIIGQLIDKLYTHHYRSSIMMCIREYFEDDGFESKMDTNPSLLGVYNCVIELTPSGASVRGGKPEDYITKKMGVSYRSEYDYNSQDVKDLLKYLRQVFPEPTILEWMKKDIAALLYGRNVEKSFRLWIGDTNGSKSIFQLMLHKMFGDYAKDLPSAWYSQTKINVSGSSPEFAQLAGSRVVFSPEPDAGLDFRADRIKILTGGDSQFGRGNFKDGGSVNPSYNAIMPLNRIPNIANLDEAAKERFTMIPFEGRWVKEEEDIEVAENFEEQIKKKLYKMDKRFEKQVPRLAMALLWLSVEYYTKYIEEGHKKPEYMMRYMKDYWKANDPYLCFIDEFLVKKEKEVECKKCAGKDEKGCSKCKDGIRHVIDKDFKLRTKQVFPIFKKWLKSGDHQMRTPKQGQFTTDMSTRDKLGKQDKWEWVGWALKTEDSDDEESDDE